MIGVAGVAAAVVFLALAIPQGEVVTITTVDEAGGERDTQLWIVTLEEGQYLRASTPDNRWLAHLRERPVILLRPEGAYHESGERYRALPGDDPQLRRRVNAAMSRKYGFADVLWGVLGDRAETVPILIERIGIARDGLEGIEALPGDARVSAQPVPATDPSAH
jgi:hypothetical protein